MKTAGEYFDSLAALTTAKGFQAEGEPHEFSVGTAKLVRGDFSKARGTLTMRQASLVMVAEEAMQFRLRSLAGAKTKSTN